MYSVPFTAGPVSQAMRCIGVQAAQRTFPSGDPNFAVMQSFPAGFPAEVTDPFLMCDEFGPTPSKGRATHPDEFPLAWHPHCGMDIVTYLVQGIGRHGDSMGNRGEFRSPGMQWISCGSGIEHAEGGGTPAGQLDHGFQIWINVPSARKMDDPRYGTETPETIPDLRPQPGVAMRLLAGSSHGATGPFRTVQPVQMVDVYGIGAGVTYHHPVPMGFNTCLVYVYRGSATVGGHPVGDKQIAQLDANDPGSRILQITGGPGGAGFMIFAGVKLGQPIAWQGPFVMTTQSELSRAWSDYQRGALPYKRAPWNYKKVAERR